MPIKGPMSQEHKNKIREAVKLRSKMKKLGIKVIVPVIEKKKNKLFILESKELLKEKIDICTNYCICLEEEGKTIPLIGSDNKELLVNMITVKL